MNNNAIASQVGLLFIIGTVAGVFSAVFTGPIVESSNILAKIAANENRTLLGVLFILIMGICLAWIPVVLYPVVSKVNQTLALGYVVFRGALETFTYIANVMVWIMLAVLSQEYSNQSLSRFFSDSIERLNSITMIVFSLGALMLYSLFIQSKLLPGWLSWWGFIASLVYLATGVSAFFGSPFTPALMPLALQEMVMAIWLMVRGFDSKQPL